MKFSINGKEMSFEKQITVENLLKELKIDVSKIAIEHNKALLPRSSYSEQMLAEGDELEIVAFVGGG